jgi:PEP-CTERM motif-containing protein
MRKVVLPALFLLALSASFALAQSAFVFGYTYPPYETGYVALYLNGSPVYANYTGWYDSSGFHDANNPDYIAQTSGGSQVYNNFFEFTVPGGTYTSAYLSIFNPSLAPGFTCFSGCSNTFVYYNWDVTTPIADVIASQSGRTDIFLDLGSGVLYGGVAVGVWTNGTQVIVPLDAAALASINTAAGGDWIVGGSLGTIPEPGTLLMLGTGLLGTLGILKRKLNL